MLLEGPGPKGAPALLTDPLVARLVMIPESGRSTKGCWAARTLPEYKGRGSSVESGNVIHQLVRGHDTGLLRDDAALADIARRGVWSPWVLFGSYPGCPHLG